MNDDQRYISGFLQVFETKPEIFEQEGAVEALASLNQTISQMVDKCDEEVADAIGKWCKNYPKIREMIKSISRKPDPKSIKKEEQEPRLSNRYPELP